MRITDERRLLIEAWALGGLMSLAAARTIVWLLS
jgi:hypothetical protein